MTRRIGMLIFPRLTQLDMTGPYEVLARLPDTKVDLVAQHDGAGDDRPRHADRADRDLRDLPAARHRHGAGRSGPAGPDGGRGGAVVPAQAGGGGEIRDLGLHRLAGARRRRPAQGQARHLPLGGDRASCSRSAPSRSSERVVIDGNIVTGAGVASGIDFALTLAAILEGEEVAREIQLADRVRPGAAVRFRLAEDGAAGDASRRFRRGYRSSTRSGARWRPASARKLGTAR